MLVLVRKLHEEIVIDGNIRVTVVGVSGGRVRLGLTAPPDVPVSRGELSLDSLRRVLTPAERTEPIPVGT